MISLPKAKTPSFVLPGSAVGGTPKAPSINRSHELSLLPPPATVGRNGQTTSEADDLREKLRQAEAHAQRHYDEMKEYQSWVQQVKEGQGTLKGTNDEVLDPVPDNPPGLWDQRNGQDGSIGSNDQGQDVKDCIARISRKKHEKISIKPWSKCQDLDVWRSNVVQAVCVASGDPYSNFEAIACEVTHDDFHAWANFQL